MSSKPPFSAADDVVKGEGSDGMSFAAEGLVAVSPVKVRRRILWGDCDPANVVYTPRFADYAASARDWFMLAGMRVKDRPVALQGGVGFPMRAMSFDFRSFLKADDLLEMTVTVDAVTSRTFTLLIYGARSDGACAFIARCTSVCVDLANGRAINLPAPLRDSLTAYQAKHPTPPDAAV